MENVEDRLIWVRDIKPPSRPLPLRKTLSLPFVRLCVYLAAGTFLFVYTGLALDYLWRSSRQNAPAVNTGADVPNAGLTPNTRLGTAGPQEQNSVKPDSTESQKMPPSRDSPSQQLPAQ